MTITTTGLTRAAGLSAAAAGLIFIAVQINHPPMDVASVATTEWVVRNSAKVAMGALALVGITGMYLRQVRQVGVLGLIGYLLLRRRLPAHVQHRGHLRLRPPGPGEPRARATSTTSSSLPPEARRPETSAR